MKVLIVDDSDTDAYHVSAILDKCGYELLRATNGQEGYEMAIKHQPDVILMDVIMPKTNGFQSTRLIKKDEKTKHIPVIVISSKNQETDKIWAARQGACMFLVKPADENVLLSAIEKNTTRT